MPPTPSKSRKSPDRRRTSRDASSPSQHVGSKQSGLYETTSVQDRIRQWQAHGAATAPAPDAVSVRSQPRSEVSRTPATSEPNSPSEESAHVSTRKDRSKETRRANKEWNLGTQAVHEPEQPVSDPETEKSPDTLTQTDMPSKTKSKDRVLHETQRARNITSSRAERDERRQRRKEARTRPTSRLNTQDDGIRVYAKDDYHHHHHHHHPTRTENTPNGDLASVVEDEASSRAPTPSRTPSASNVGTVEDMESEGIWRKPSKYAQTLGKPPEYEELELSKPRKKDLLGKTKDLLVGKHDRPVPLSNRIPSIQAWLEDQTDPFVDDDSSSRRPDTEAPKPQDSRTKRKRAKVDNTIPKDANKIWDSVSIAPEENTEYIATSDPIKSVAESGSRRRTHERRQFSFEEDKQTIAMPERRKFSFEADPEPQDMSPTSKSMRDRQKFSPSEEKRRQRASRRRNYQPTLLPPDDRPVQTPENQSTELVRTSKPLPAPPTERDLSVNNPTDVFVDPTAPIGSVNGLKRRLTTHEDLMTVLSQSKAHRSVKPTRSARQPDNTHVDAIRQVIDSLKIEEAKYLRELRTLVDGVTPVLLQSLLSKTDSAAAAGLFSDDAKEDANFARPIIEMGVALEKLKSLHARIPLHNVESLLLWAQTAQKLYSEYIKAWRLGFQGVIVNLAPLDSLHANDDEIMARDTDGDVIDAEGKKVDVAYLQKRPLVRVKKLAKDIATISEMMPENPAAAKVNAGFAELTELARQRHREEQGRLEDEAATRTDITRVRDFKTMAPAAVAYINPTRRVRARDCFSMTLYHSTGQRMDCRIELILRDNQSTQSPGGDVLICQMEGEGKWLLFEPIELNKISSRKGEEGCDLVIMIRGTHGIGREWSELLALQAEDPEAIAEWINMLGSNPLPHKLSRVPSFLDRKAPNGIGCDSLPGVDRVEIGSDIPMAHGGLNDENLAMIPSDVDVPIGEPSVVSQKRQQKRGVPKKGFLGRALPKLNLGGGLQKKALPQHYCQPAPSINPKSVPSSIHSSTASTISGSSSCKPLPKLTPNSELSHSSAPSRLEYSPERLPTHQAYSPQQSHLSSSSITTIDANTKDRHRGSTDQTESVVTESNLDARKDTRPTESVEESRLPQPTNSNEFSSPTPTEALPNIPKLRSSSKVSSPSSTPLTASIREQWSALSGYGQKARNSPSSTAKSIDVSDDPINAPNSVKQAHRQSLPATNTSALREDSVAPAPPIHKTSMPVRPKSIAIPIPRSSPSPPRHERDSKVISSSPLKHEYAPSSSDTESDSDSDVFSDATSDTSEELGSEIKDQAMPLVSVRPQHGRFSQSTSRPALPSLPSTGTRTLQPSDSASQGPYRRAPPPSSYSADKKKRTIALVCCWSDRGVWEPLQEDECSIVVSPGLIQAFQMSAAHSIPMAGAEWQASEPSILEQAPLVEYELTPIVPLRKGTALDITIRSPPTANSKLQTTSNIMFRSRSVMECDQLYNMINWARCNNPTYQALLRSRPREDPASYMHEIQQQRRSSWFGLGNRGKTSYRASSGPPPSSMGESAVSASSMASAFSALRKFGKNSPFSINRSSVIRRPGFAASGSLYSESIGTGTGSSSSTPPPSQAGMMPGPNGPNVPATSAEAANGGGMVNKMKIRLFIRRGANWEALGPTDLSVLPSVATQNINDQTTSLESAVPSQRTSIGGPPQTRYRLPSSGNTPHRIHGDGREKRVLITKHKKPDSVLLDATLGESCFEKVMQTGIAVKVWVEDEEVQHFGGVTTGRSQTYMLQFRTSAEAAWVFGMCGSYRYGDMESS